MNAEEVELLSDSKYRNYVAAVDKALKNFEYSSEWADLISALGKLNKVMISDTWHLDTYGIRSKKAMMQHPWHLKKNLKYDTSRADCLHMGKSLLELQKFQI